MAQTHKTEWTLEKKQEHYNTYINDKFDRKKYDNEVTQDLGISKTCTINNKLYGPRDSHNHIGYNQYFIIDNFLSNSWADKLLQWSIDAKEDYVFKTQVNRCSSLLFLNKDTKPTFKYVGKQIHKKLQDVLENPPPGYVEMQLTRSGNGDFFGIHTDPGCAGGNDVFNRRVTFVYYLLKNNDFKDGDLVLHLEEDEKVSIPPIHNRLVIMYPFTLHEITQLSCGDEWSDGRFTFNGWFWDIKSKQNMDLYE